MKNDAPTLKSYLRPSYRTLILPAFLIVCGFACMGAVAKPIFGLVMFAGIGILSAIPFFTELSRFRSSIESYDSQHGNGKLEEEFNASNSALDGNLRMSENYLFGYHTATFIRYEEIRKIYVYVHRTNGAEDQRALRIETSGGKTRTLCNLPRKGAYRKVNHPDLTEVLKIVLLKNPSVQIGYK